MRLCRPGQTGKNTGRRTGSITQADGHGLPDKWKNAVNSGKTCVSAHLIIWRIRRHLVRPPKAALEARDLNHGRFTRWKLPPRWIAAKSMIAIKKKSPA